MINKFNEFLSESEIKSEKLIDSLTVLLNNKFPSIKKEDKYLYLYFICKYFGYNKVLFISNLEFSQDEKDVKDAFVLLNKYAFNPKGYFNKTDIIKKSKFSKNAYNDFVYKDDYEFLLKVIEKTESNLSDSKKKQLESFVKDFSKKMNT